MARSPILTLAKDVASDLGMVRPSSLFSGYNEGDTNDYKLLRALRRACNHLQLVNDWQDLTETVEFTTTANGVQAGVRPADFSRVVEGSIYDLTNSRGGVFVKTFAPLPVGRQPERIELAVTRTQLLLRSPHAVGATLQFKYIRDCIGENAAGDLISAFTADTDKALWSDELLHLGMVWAIGARDGMPSGPDYDAFLARLMSETSAEADGGALTFGTLDPEDALELPRAPTSAW